MSPRSLQDNEATRTASRTRVLEAARTLFADRGFFACRVADIARQAGMSPGNVYWLFESKEAILRAILADGFERLVAMCAEVADEYGPARRRLDILVERTVETYQRNEAFSVILGGLMGQGGQDLVRRLGFEPAEIRGRCHANLRRVFAEARAEGAVAAADPDELATCYLALFDGLVISYGDRWRAMPREVVRAAALRAVGYRPAG
jgi:AcrR family transcriptional regulator